VTVIHGDAVVAAMEAALARRASEIDALASEGTDCFRLFDGAADGVDGLVVEVFGPAAILQEHVGRYRGRAESLSLAARWVLDRLPSVRSVYRKRFVADRTAAEEEAAHRSPEPFAGEVAEPVVVARESGFRFRIRPYDGYSVGLFLDQRANRRFVTDALVSGQAALNLFAYTGGFSVYAAAKGARVDTIDLSRRYLEWARENFEANGLPKDAHRFFADNAVTFLKRAVKRPKRYDLIVLDPPSFSRSREGTFRVRADLPALARTAAELLAPGGLLFVSSNHEGWPVEAFAEELSGALDGQPLAAVSLPPVPFDFRESAEPLRAVAWRRGPR
jgi:23S rRNA (cytosine1962-C5)-methyltransferase